MFHFKNSCLLKEGLVDIVSKGWMEPIDVLGSLNIWQFKFRRLWKVLKGWNKTAEGGLISKTELSDKIIAMDLIAEQTGLTLQMYE